MAVEVREAASPEDKRRSLDIYNTVEPWEAVTPEEVARFEALADATLELVASVDGEDVGSAVCSIQPQSPGAAFTLIDVLPHARSRGAGSALYAACSAFAREHGRTRLETRIVADDEASRAFASRRGFVEVGREDWLELAVPSTPPAAAPPPGVEIVQFDGARELAAGAFDVSCEALPDIPGEYEDGWSPPDRDTWIEHFGPTPPFTTFVAVAEGTVVGYAQLRRQSDTLASHNMTAVRRAWRRRGVARALKSAQIEWAARNGIERLRATNEVRNAPMRSVNLALGYVTVRGRVTLRGPAI